MGNQHFLGHGVSQKTGWAEKLVVKMNNSAFRGASVSSWCPEDRPWAVSGMPEVKYFSYHRVSCSMSRYESKALAGIGSPGEVKVFSLVCLSCCSAVNQAVFSPLADLPQQERRDQPYEGG